MKIFRKMTWNVIPHSAPLRLPMTAAPQVVKLGENKFNNPQP